MMQLRAIGYTACVLALLTGPVFAPVSAVAQSAAVEGAALAQKLCSECHDVGGKGSPSPKASGNPGPAFRDIAQKPVMTKLAIRVFMRSTHPNMPDIILSDGEIDAVSDFITSLN